MYSKDYSEVDIFPKVIPFDLQKLCVFNIQFLMDRTKIKKSCQAIQSEILYVACSTITLHWTT